MTARLPIRTKIARPSMPSADRDAHEQTITLTRRVEHTIGAKTFVFWYGAGVPFCGVGCHMKALAYARKMAPITLRKAIKR
jgi:hypothetical protein